MKSGSIFMYQHGRRCLRFHPTLRSTSSMNEVAEPMPNSADQPGSLLVLALLALIVGAVAGILGALFRLALAQADRLRDAAIALAHGQHNGSLLVILACAAATSLAAWLVREFSPPASGSGIPHVEAVLHEEVPLAPFRLIPVKFFGGLLAIGAGLALGREGPTVQMGAGIAHLVGKVFRRNWPDCRVLLAAGAGAGLATAFNAPMAGAAFVLEELVRRYEPRIAIAALGASATAISVSRLFLGTAPDFFIGALTYPGVGVRPLYFGLGAFAGIAAVVYNQTLLGTLAAAERLRFLPVELRAALIGAAVGALAWIAPDLVGAATRSPSARSSEWNCLRSFPTCSCCALRSARSHMLREPRAACLLPCWCSARNSACSSGWPASTPSPISTSSRRASPSSAWPRFSPGSYALRSPASCSSPK